MPKKIIDSGFRNWKVDRLPNLTGKTYLITGGNSGIGFEAAEYLGKAGGNIIIAARNPEKARRAVEALKPQVKGTVKQVSLDLADLSSVRAAADETRSLTASLDGLINNAGIMQTPPQKTKDGFEMQIGTNHLGHFLLDGLLFDLVEAAEGRIVTVSSIAHKYGSMYLDDLMMTKNYSPTYAYGQSKLANMLYAMELDRRLKASGKPVTSYACHPGYSDTSLQSTGPKGFWNNFYKVSNALFAQPAEKGAIPTVLCAAGEEAVPGAYYGPTGMGESRGPVGDALVSEKALDVADAQNLWQQSEALVDFSWDSILPAG
ncbi:MAG: oxidoreductase [Pseudomonadota bacterium]